MMKLGDEALTGSQGHLCKAVIQYVDTQVNVQVHFLLLIDVKYWFKLYCIKSMMLQYTERNSKVLGQAKLISNYF